MRVLFSSVALPGHFFPLVPLAWACRSMGHDVVVAAAANFVPEVLRSGLPSVCCGPEADFVGFSAAGDQHSLAERRYANGRVFGRNAARCLAGIMSVVDSWRPHVIVSERAESAGPVAAAVAGVPAVELQWGVAPLTEYRSAATDELGDEMASLGLATLPSPTLVLSPWPPSLRLAHAAGHRSMRNVPYDGDARVPSWVWRPRERPRVCLTLGTVLPRLGIDGMSEIVTPMLESLGRLDLEVVVAVEDKIAASWPPLPAAARHVGRMPLSQVLQACEVTIHHGGQGTALTALGAGNPQLILPVFDDQFDNADAVVRSGAGLSLLPEELTPQAIADRCLELLGDEEFTLSAAAVAEEITAQPGLVEVVGQLEELAA
jgi:UDP:flavonoid glycosyltransferase YjiC (YdhE family)